MNSERFKLKWQAIPCPHGANCWCRMITTVLFNPDIEQFYSKYNEEHFIVGSANLNKEEAEHIVKCHNFYLEHHENKS